MIRTLQKHGNSHALVIERALMDELGIGPDTPVQITVSGGSLTITAVNVGLGREEVGARMKQVRSRYGRALKKLAAVSRSEIRFLSVQDVLEIHQDTISREGGRPGIREIGLIESAVAMPRQAMADAYLHADLCAMAAAYWFHLTANHGFIDGNKRVGLAAAMVFLLANGVTKLPEPDAAEGAAFALAAGGMTKQQLTAWLREAVGP